MTDIDKLVKDSLLQAARQLERAGLPITAQLLRNEAYMLEHPEEFQAQGANQ